MSNRYTKALDLVQNGDWAASHAAIQPFGDELSCLIHAYLHRLEGDFENAQYWYRRAGGATPEDRLAEEFHRLTALAMAQGLGPS